MYQNGYQYFDEFYSFGDPYSTIAFYIPGTEWTTCNDWEICMTCKASSSAVSLWMHCSNQTFIDEMNAGSSVNILQRYWAQYMRYDSILGTSDKEIHFGYYNTNYPPKDYWTGWVFLDGSGDGITIDLYIKNLWVNAWMINQDHGV